MRTLLPLLFGLLLLNGCAAMSDPNSFWYVPPQPDQSVVVVHEHHEDPHVFIRHEEEHPHVVVREPIRRAPEHKPLPRNEHDIQHH